MPGAKENSSLKLKFGNGDYIPFKLLDGMAQLSLDFAEEIEWKDRDFVYLNNQIVMLGRRAFLGDKKRLV